MAAAPDYRTGNVKQLVMISRRPDMSFEAFRAYYEANHVPLIRRVLPMMDAYKRNYVNAARVTFGGFQPDYDCLTEISFRTEADFAAFQAALADPATIAVIREDAAKFQDTAKIRYIFVEEYAGPAPARP